ncbi:MAG: FAD-dependent oxidoreductase [Clostridia bacterium]|nr:FAD-dependent oxidoreductase [Clostridia bacterium]
MSRLVTETKKQSEKALEGLYADAARRLSASPNSLCPVDMSLNMIRLFHAQSCGKCTPCRVGLGQLANLLEDVLDGNADLLAIDLIEKTANVIRDTADCAIGFEAADFALKAVKGFRDDFEAHITTGRCTAEAKSAIPCTAICPAHVDVPAYINLIKAGRNEDAVRIIRKDNPFPSVCGYVCEHPCEAACRRMMVDDAVNICGLKRYAVDNAKEIAQEPQAEATGKTVAVIGGGPSGLTTAYYLALMGHKVTVYEQRAKLGGMLRYGIPDYRLPQDVLDKDIQYILDAGVTAIVNTSVGKDITFEEIKSKFDAVYLSIGAHSDKKLGIEGETSNGVVSAVTFLRAAGEHQAIDLTGKRVVVVGGGNVAMDATRTSLRLGAASVTCAYRRRIDDMTALAEEIEECQAEGAKILALHAPDHIEADENGNVAAMWFKPQMISTIGSDGRPSVKAAAKEPLRLECDYIVVAIGQAIDSAHFAENGIETKRGQIVAKASSLCADKVFAGGDAVSGPATVIRAVAAGKVAADNIDEFLGYKHSISVDVELPTPMLAPSPACGRVNLASNIHGSVNGNFEIVNSGMTEQEAMQECGRCLQCDRFGLGLFQKGRALKW